MEYIYKIAPIGDTDDELAGPVTVEAGNPAVITVTHRRVHRRRKRHWPHAPARVVPIRAKSVMYYRVDRTPPLSTHTGRVLCDDESLYLPAPGEGLGNPWTPKGGRGVQLSRMFAKARRRQQKSGVG